MGHLRSDEIMDSSSTYVLKNLSVFHGNDLDLIKNAEITIVDGKVSRVINMQGTVKSLCTTCNRPLDPLAQSSKVLNLSGYVAVPSFINLCIIADRYSLMKHAVSIFGGVSSASSKKKDNSEMLLGFLSDVLSISRKTGTSYANIILKNYPKSTLDFIKRSLSSHDVGIFDYGDLDDERDYDAATFPSGKTPRSRPSKYPSGYAVDIPRARLFKDLDISTEKNFLSQESFNRPYCLYGGCHIMATGNIPEHPTNFWLSLSAEYREKASEHIQDAATLLGILKSATTFPAAAHGLPGHGKIVSGADATFQIFHMPKDWDGTPTSLLKYILTRVHPAHPDYAMIVRGVPIKASRSVGTNKLIGDFLAEKQNMPVAGIGKAFDPVEDAIKAFKNGELVVVVDEESRENEGDLIIPAQDITGEKFLFMLKNTTGIICVSMDKSLTEKLDLELMVPSSTDRFNTAFTVSCDYIEGTTSGVSLKDRVITIKKLACPNSRPSDFSRPGHIFPLLPKGRGIVDRQGHTESAWELCRLAGKTLAAALAELVDDTGDTMNYSSCLEFADKWGLKIISTKDLHSYVTCQVLNSYHPPL